MGQRSKIGYIVSLKYTPGHAALLEPFARQFERAVSGETLYLLSRSYSWMLRSRQLRKVLFVGTSDNARSMLQDSVLFLLYRWIIVFFNFWRTRPVAVYFVNPHPLNPIVAVLGKIANPACRVITHLHEPEPNADTGTWQSRGYERVIRTVQACSLRVSSDIIVSSKRALDVISAKQIARSKRVHLVPLLYEDFAIRTSAVRRYVTYLGAANRRRGIHRFLEFAEYCFRRAADIDFQIVTKDDISEFLAGIDPQAAKRIQLINKPNIANTEIAEALTQSVACCVLYMSDMAQSGVVPVSLMSGTPLIVTPFGGLSEALTDGRDCVVLSREVSCAELLDAVRKIQGNLETMSPSARRTYDEKFHENNWQVFFARLLRRDHIPASPFIAQPRTTEMSQNAPSRVTDASSAGRS